MTKNCKENVELSAPASFYGDMLSSNAAACACGRAQNGLIRVPKQPGRSEEEAMGVLEGL